MTKNNIEKKTNKIPAKISELDTLEQKNFFYKEKYKDFTINFNKKETNIIDILEQINGFYEIQFLLSQKFSNEEFYDFYWNEKELDKLKYVSNKPNTQIQKKIDLILFDLKNYIKIKNTINKMEEEIVNIDWHKKTLKETIDFYREKILLEVRELKKSIYEQYLNKENEYNPILDDLLYHNKWKKALIKEMNEEKEKIAWNYMSFKDYEKLINSWDLEENKEKQPLNKQETYKEILMMLFYWEDKNNPDSSNLKYAFEIMKKTNKWHFLSKKWFFNDMKKYSDFIYQTRYDNNWKNIFSNKNILEMLIKYKNDNKPINYHVYNQIIQSNFDNEIKNKLLVEAYTLGFFKNKDINRRTNYKEFFNKLEEINKNYPNTYSETDIKNKILISREEIMKEIFWERTISNHFFNKSFLLKNNF